MALSSSPLSRRSVAKGVAWTAPVVAIAATAPMAAATKVPPTTVIRFGGACGNTGSDGKGCGGDKTIQVPLTLTNLTGADLVFQVTSMYTCLNKNNTCEEAPTGPGAGVVEGTRGIWTTAVPGQFSPTNACGTPVYSTCGGGTVKGKHRRPEWHNRCHLLDRVQQFGLGERLLVNHQLPVGDPFHGIPGLRSRHRNTR